MMPMTTTRKHKMDSMFDLDLLSLPRTPSPKTPKRSHNNDDSINELSFFPISKKQKVVYIKDDYIRSAPPPQLPLLLTSDDDDSIASINNQVLVTPRLILLNTNWTEEAPPRVPYLIDDDDCIIEDNNDNRKSSFILLPRFNFKESTFV